MAFNLSDKDLPPLGTQLLTESGYTEVGNLQALTQFLVTIDSHLFGIFFGRQAHGRILNRSDGESYGYYPQAAQVPCCTKRLE
jgi:hypothetical protein